MRVIDAAHPFLIAVLIGLIASSAERTFPRYTIAGRVTVAAPDDGCDLYEIDDGNCMRARPANLDQPWLDSCGGEACDGLCVVRDHGSIYIVEPFTLAAWRPARETEHGYARGAWVAVDSHWISCP